MESVYRLIIRRPWPILVIVFLITIFFAFHARHIRIDSSLDGLLPDGDPEKQYYDEIRRLFGSDDVAVIALITDNVYTPQTLQKIQRLTDEFRKLPEVKSVLSLTNAKDVVADVLGDGMEPALLVPEIPTTLEAAAAIKEKIANQPLYLKVIVSPDGRAAAINVFFLESITEKAFLERGIDEKIQAIIDREQGPEQIHYTGLPHFKAASARAQQEDLTFLLPLTFGLILVVLYLCMRSIRGVVLPTLTVLISLTWVLGIMVLAGSQLSVGTIALPSLLLVLGVAYSLHVITEYYELARPDRTAAEVVLETLHSINLPVLMAAFTTVLGFLSLFVNRIVGIREMGVYSAIGITIAFLLAIVFVPACLVLLPLPRRAQDIYAPGLSAALHKLTRGVIRYRRALIAGSIVVAILSAVPIPSIRVGSNFLSFFRKSHPTSVANDAVNQALGGGMAFYVVIDGTTPDLMRKEDTLRRMKDLQLYINSQPGVSKTLSFVDYCEAVDKGIQALPAEDGSVPVLSPTAEASFWGNQTRLNEVLQIIFNGSGVSTFVNHPMYSRANIQVRTSLSQPSDIAALVNNIQTFANEHFPSEIQAHPTGNLILNTRTIQNLISGQVQSLALTAGVIFIIMSVMFLSFRVGMIAMIPNVFPILFFFGLLGVSGAVLSLTTSMIASIVLGLAVDDTIHIMSRLSAETRTTTNQEEALLGAIGTVGKPTLYYSLLVLLGFLAFSVSTFTPLQQFGILSAITVFVGVVAELILLPALLAATPVITVWNVLALKLGQDPHKTIPLFAGLRSFQAKIVTLMGELKSFSQGQPIIRQGEMGNEMYVVINGTADVVMNTSTQPRRLGRVGRGDVFGEMGLIRHHERMADVIATEDVEVLAVNEQFLNRLKRRYPRIATEIFFNLSKMLSDRLEAAQRR